MVDFGKRPGDMMKEDYDTDDSGVVDEVEALPDHADDHEDAGDDELSVAALSGELADAQPVKAHDLAGGRHNVATLTNLNLLISDATLDTSSAARTPSAHAASHQNGGTDEPTVAGLSGELADDQPPKAHDLAGADHNVDTLADLNLKVSDATLDDSAATRTPASHAASHEDDGTDEIDCTGLAGAGGAGILADGTPGRVLRSSWLAIQNGTNANTLKPWMASRWNGDAIAETDNVPKNGSVGAFALDADGYVLTINASGLSGNVLLAIGHCYSNQSTTDITWYLRASSNNIIVAVFNATTGAALDLTALVDTGLMSFDFIYLTDA